jgi:hypothetical protein
MPERVRRVPAPGRARKTPEPEPINNNTLLRRLREAAEELLFTADDATSPAPFMTRKSLRRSAYEDGVSCARALRFAQREIEAVEMALVMRGAR